MRKKTSMNETSPIGQAVHLVSDAQPDVPIATIDTATGAIFPGPKNPDRCIVVKTVADRERAYCTVDHGSRVEEEFRVNGKTPEGAEDQLKAFAHTIALHVAQEARQRDIEVVRVSNADAGRATAAALREAGFHVIEFAD